MLPEHCADVRDRAEVCQLVGIDEGGSARSRSPRNARRTLAAIRHLEEKVVGAGVIEGIVLRYGGFYGPGTFPLIGGAAGMWSFVHIDDAAEATVAAIERGEPGIYNVVDDEPAAASEWLPYLADALGAKPPRRVPAWLGRIVAGDQVVSLMTQTRGASNVKAEREPGWRPRYRSWREGFVDGLTDGAARSSRAATPFVAAASLRRGRAQG